MKEKYQVEYSNFIKEVERNVFGFNNIQKVTLGSQYHELIESILMANDVSYKLFSEILGEEANEQFEEAINADDIKEALIEIVEHFVIKTYEKKSYAVDKVCLRKNLLRCAVHMKTNIEQMGFISELIDGDSRFVYVDFGDKDGAVKIDIDEIIIAERI